MPVDTIEDSPQAALAPTVSESQSRDTPSLKHINGIQGKSAQDHVRELLDNMKNKCPPLDTTPNDQMDAFLNALSYKDFPELQRPCAKLTVKSKDKLLDIFFPQPNHWNAWFAQPIS